MQNLPIYGDPTVMNFLNDAFPFAVSRYQENISYDNALTPSLMSLTLTITVIMISTTGFYGKYNRLLREVLTSLYPGSEHTMLGTVMEQMKVKNKRGKSNVCFDDDMALMKKVIPKGCYWYTGGGMVVIWYGGGSGIFRADWKLGDFMKSNRNKRFPEGSITAAYIHAEVRNVLQHISQ
ncbi:hypothetical protein ACLB2K_017001 [Fragaria x ananassa]